MCNIMTEKMKKLINYSKATGANGTEVKRVNTTKNNKALGHKGIRGNVIGGLTSQRLSLLNVKNDIVPYCLRAFKTGFF